jgi:glycosyltransferase involved in cell wall biosynthesis
MVETARTRQVLIVNSIGTRVPVRGRSTMPLRRITRKARSVAKLMRQPLAERPGLHVMTPLSIPILESDRWRRFNAALVRVQVKVALRHLGIRDPVVVVTVPTAWDVVRDLPRRCTVYNRADKHSLFEESDQRAILELESELLSGANYVVYANRGLMEEESDLVGERGVLLDHGVDLDHFRRRSAAEEPAPLRQVPHPRIGYIGAIRDYVTDLDLLLHVAKSLPDAQLVIIGDSLCEIDDLVALPNVHWLGFKPYEDIPRYGSGIDVAIMPFLGNEWIRYANPIKLKECLALGLPIVTTPFGDSERYTSVLTIATDRDEFVEGIRQALLDGSQERRDERRAFVRKASWLGRSRCLMALAEQGERPRD